MTELQQYRCLCKIGLELEGEFVRDRVAVPVRPLMEEAKEGEQTRTLLHERSDELESNRNGYGNPAAEASRR